MSENLIQMESIHELGAIKKRIGELKSLLKDARDNLKHIKEIHGEKEAGEKDLTVSTIHHIKLEDELSKEIREYEKNIAALEERKSVIEDKVTRKK